MHSKIFQITTTKVDKECYLNEDTLMQGDNSYFDYCCEIGEEERKYHIDILVNHILPKGMFELVDEDTIRYIGGAEKWKEEFVAGLRNKVEAVTPDTVQDWIGPVYQLEKYLKNPLETAYWFYTDTEGMQSYAEQSYVSSCVRFVGMNPARCSTSEASLIIISDSKLKDYERTGKN